MQTGLLLNALISSQEARAGSKTQAPYPACSLWATLSLQLGQSELYLFHKAGMTTQIYVGYLGWQKDHFSIIAL